MPVVLPGTHADILPAYSSLLCILSFSDLPQPGAQQAILLLTSRGPFTVCSMGTAGLLTTRQNNASELLKKQSRWFDPPCVLAPPAWGPGRKREHSEPAEQYNQSVLDGGSFLGSLRRPAQSFHGFPKTYICTDYLSFSHLLSKHYQ